MCGILGIASTQVQQDRAWLSKGRDMMSHRGPDDSGEWWSEDGLIGFAHRRLSILELSTLGKQPMQLSRDEKTYSLIFNGEIYNFPELRKELEHLGHRFHSKSDTEILLASYAEWGANCLDRLHGMFAFALYDASRRTLLLARDRAGEKPLFYIHTGESLFFASELKALLENPALPRQLNFSSLDLYLMMGYVPGNRCILEGYQKLEAGHALEFNLSKNSVRSWAYWQLPEWDAKANQASESHLLDELESLLEESVRRQLVADVPVGILLSGGVDSSLVTAMAARCSNEIQTFSVGFPGHGAFDETAHARQIATHFGTKHTELIAEPATVDVIELLVRQVDEPMVDTSMIPTYLVTKLIREHCTVALGGDGGDELFGGYGHHQNLLKLQSNQRFIPPGFRGLLSLTADHVLPIGFKGRMYLTSLQSHLSRELPLIRTHYTAKVRKQLLKEGYELEPKAEQALSSYLTKNTDLVDRATRFDFKSYLTDQALVKVDRASMVNSLEVRAPMLDHRIIEFAFSKVPPSLKTTLTGRKILLKKLTERVLPPEFDRKRKQGFSVPLSDWIKTGAFRTLFMDVLLDKESLFDPKMIHKLFAEQSRGYSNGERLFALVQFELWRKTYHIQL